MSGEDKKSNESGLIVRRARSEDRDAVLAFCARTWGDDGDYIPYVWDDWLADMNGESARHGVLLVATLDERPVGITHIRLLSEDEAWLEGVRVDPTERRAGVGRAMIAQALKAAQARGATVARFFTDETNIASQRLFEGFGFTRVAQMIRYSA
ncbi:MAG TPA: GNAT family N-acetyltransferase, partial [Ktedonobacterales bacterium]|nr:GNAT family N-acetyltransferase [Ktedonobacterales bacterium]